MRKQLRLAAALAAGLSAGGAQAQTAAAPVSGHAALASYMRAGESDQCAALQRAHDANPGGVIELPAGVIELGTAAAPCSIEWTASIRLVGQGWNETHASGTVLHIPPQPAGWNGPATFHVAGPAARGSVFRGFSIRQDQPPPAPGWRPRPYAPVFFIDATMGQVTIQDILAAPVYDLVKADRSGRLAILDVRAQALNSLAAIDRSYDSDRYIGLHVWPYWSTQPDVLAWQQEHLRALRLGRVDTPFLDQIFMIHGRSLVSADGSPDGPPSKIEAGALACDFCALAIDVGAPDVTASIGSLMWQGQSSRSTDPIVGGRAVSARGKNARLRISRMVAERSEGAAIDAPGAGAAIMLGETHVNLINQGRSGAAVVGALGQGAVVSFALPPFIERSNGADCGACAIAGAGAGASQGAPPAATPASLVNQARLVGGPGGAGVGLSAEGADPRIDLALTPKGDGGVVLGGGGVASRGPITAPYFVASGAGLQLRQTQAARDRKMWDLFVEETGDLTVRSLDDRVTAANRWLRLRRGAGFERNIVEVGAPIVHAGAAPSCEANAVSCLVTPGSTANAGVIALAATKSGVAAGAARLALPFPAGANPLVCVVGQDDTDAAWSDSAPAPRVTSAGPANVTIAWSNGRDPLAPGKSYRLSYLCGGR